LYLFLYQQLRPSVGPGIILLSLAPAALSGWILGIWGGLSTGILLGVFTVGLEYGYDSVNLGQMLHDGVAGHLAVLAFTGALIGWVRDLRSKIQNEKAAQQRLEKSLGEAQERFDVIVDYMYAWEYWLDVEGKILYTSNSSEQVCGYRPADFMQDPGLLGRMIHPADRERIAEHFATEASLSGLFSTEFRILTAAGEERWIGHVCQPVHSESGNSLGRRISNRDITERMKAERELQRSERLLRSAISGAPVILFSLNGEGQITLLEGNGLSAIGVKAGNLIGKNIKNGEVESEIFTLALRALNGQDYSTSIKGIQDRIFDVTYSPLRDSEGQIIGATGLATDVTERRQAEETLFRQARIYENLSDAVIVTDLQGYAIDLNPATVKMFGFTKEEVLGRKTGALLSLTKGFGSMTRVLESVARTGRWSGEVVFTRKDGAQRIAESVVLPLMEEGSESVTALLGIHRDITDRKQAEAKLRMRNRELALLNDVIAATVSSLEPEAILQTTLEKLTVGFGFQQANAMVLEGQGRYLRVVVEYQKTPGYRWAGMRLPVKGNLAIETILEQRVPLAVSDVESNPFVETVREMLQQRGVVSLIILPLIARGQVIGMMNLESQTPRQFNQEEIWLAFSATAAAAQAMENASLYLQVTRLAVTDSVTDLYNRRGILDLGRREVERARRYQRPLSAIMLDIDHFKVVNDRFGHIAGDQALRMVADRCRQNVRATDLLSRYGGEEFVIILPETDLQTACEVAERLRLAIADVPLQMEDAEFQLTASFGVAEADENTPDLISLIDSADSAMYAAKVAGRNRVMLNN